MWLYIIWETKDFILFLGFKFSIRITLSQPSDPTTTTKKKPLMLFPQWTKNLGGSEWVNKASNTWKLLQAIKKSKAIRHGNEAKKTKNRPNLLDYNCGYNNEVSDFWAKLSSEREKTYVEKDLIGKWKWEWEWEKWIDCVEREKIRRRNIEMAVLHRNVRPIFSKRY